MPESKVKQELRRLIANFFNEELVRKMLPEIDDLTEAEAEQALGDLQETQRLISKSDEEREMMAFTKTAFDMEYAQLNASCDRLFNSINRILADMRKK